VNPATILRELGDRGITIRADRGRLGLRPREAVDADILALVQQHKAALLILLDLELRWRVAAMRCQMRPPPDPIPLLMARPDAIKCPGSCLSCGEVLGPEDEQSACRAIVRCHRCVEAARIVIEQIDAERGEDDARTTTK
jgi:hypothetical protein